MRRLLLLILAMLLAAPMLPAQLLNVKKQAEPLELGLAPFQVSLAPRDFSYFTPSQNLFSIGPGIFFRYHWNNVSLRSSAIWFDQRDATGPSGNCFDCTTWDQDRNRVLQVSAGSQLNLSLKRSNFYLFGDLYLRHSRFEGTYFNPWGFRMVNYEVESNGVGMRSGSGFSLRLFWKIHLSAELFFDVLKSWEEIEESPTGTEETNFLISRNFVVSAGARSMLSVKF